MFVESPVRTWELTCDHITAGKGQCPKRLNITAASEVLARAYAAGRGWFIDQNKNSVCNECAEIANALSDRQAKAEAERAARDKIHCPKCGKTAEDPCAYAAASCKRHGGHDGRFAQDFVKPEDRVSPRSGSPEGRRVQALNDERYARMVGRDVNSRSQSYEPAINLGQAWGETGVGCVGGDHGEAETALDRARVDLATTGQCAVHVGLDPGNPETVVFTVPPGTLGEAVWEAPEGKTYGESPVASVILDVEEIHRLRTNLDRATTAKDPVQMTPEEENRRRAQQRGYGFNASGDVQEVP